MYKLAFANRNLQLPYAHQNGYDGNSTPEDGHNLSNLEMLDMLTLKSEMSLYDARTPDVVMGFWNPKKEEIDKEMAQRRRTRHQGEASLN